MSEIIPHISPDLTINTELSFLGTAACNDYLGSFSYDNVNDLLMVDSFDATLYLCDYQSHSDFETAYFIFFNLDNSFTYFIIYDEDDEYLELLLAPGFVLHYRNSPLIFNINDNEIFNLITYPNPVQDILTIGNTGTHEITSIKLYDDLGRLVLKEKGNVNQLDISHLKSGVLFVKIETTEGETTKKIIKE
jgi:hypothetical protein